MSISRQNLKFVKPERPTGGRLSGIQVRNGVLNNLFPNLSTIGFTAGSLDLMKVYGWVDSGDTSRFQDAFFVVTKNPSNPDVDIFIFSTRDWFDYEDAHKNYLSNYLSMGPKILQWIPTQGGLSKDSQLIQLWSDPDASLPQIGETYVLMMTEPNTNIVHRKAFKVDAVSYELLRFSDSQGAYYKKIITLQINTPLNYTFTGEPVSRFLPTSTHTGLHGTFPAGASRVYGLMTLAEPISIGQGSLQVDSIYKQVVPSSVSDVLILNRDAAGRSKALLPAAGGWRSFQYSLDFGPGNSISLGRSAVIGTVIIQVAGGATLTESKGSLWSGQTEVATVNSESGLITPLPGSPVYTGLKTVNFVPAGSAIQPTKSARIKVTQANQSRLWSYRFPNRPAVGSILVTYMASGQWYELRDNGVNLAGDNPSIGAASMDSENLLAMSFGQAPDIGSSVLIYWAEDVLNFDRSGYPVNRAKIILTTTLPFSAGTLTIEWTIGQVQFSATVNADRIISGDAQGYVIPGSKTIVLQPDTIPPKNTQYHLTYTPYATAQETFDSSVFNGGTAQFTLLHGGIRPKSVKLVYSGLKSNNPPQYTPPDNGAGGLGGPGLGF